MWGVARCFDSFDFSMKQNFQGGGMDGCGTELAWA